uniref:Uncharacterized protein n=1 Tax=Oryza barthii TaxID=65489 RepID=A0A0D3G6A3_9ORYZ
MRPRETTTATKEETTMEAAGTWKRPMARSMASAWRTVKLSCTPMEMLRKMEELHSGRMRSTALRSSTCRTVHTRHGRSGAAASAASTSPSVITAARFRKLCDACRSRQLFKVDVIVKSVFLQY